LNVSSTKLKGSEDCAMQKKEQRADRLIVAIVHKTIATLYC